MTVETSKTGRGECRTQPPAQLVREHDMGAGLRAILDDSQGRCEFLGVCALNSQVLSEVPQILRVSSQTLSWQGAADP